MLNDFDGAADAFPMTSEGRAVRNLERAGVPRSATMEMVGRKTQSIYSRYAIADDAQERSAKLDQLHKANQKTKAQARK